MSLTIKKTENLTLQEAEELGKEFEQKGFIRRDYVIATLLKVNEYTIILNNTALYKEKPYVLAWHPEK